MEFIIWSKDRAAQLYLLLESIEKNFSNTYHKVTVLYKESDDFKDSYTSFKKNRNVNLIKENSFYEDSISLVEDARPKVCLLTDDTVFYNEIKDEEFESCFNFMNLSPDNIFSFRLGLNTVVQDHIAQTRQKELTEPVSNLIIKWKPSSYPSYTNYGYPFAIDAHLYHKHVLLSKIKSFKWNNTNDLEGGLQKFTKDVNELGCFKKSKAVNIPYNNLSGLTIVNQNNNISLEEANRKFLNGEKINLSKIEETEVVGCHQDIILEWMER